MEPIPESHEPSELDPLGEPDEQPNATSTEMEDLTIGGEQLAPDGSNALVPAMPPDEIQVSQTSEGEQENSSSTPDGAVPAENEAPGDEDQAGQRDTRASADERTAQPAVSIHANGSLSPPTELSPPWRLNILTCFLILPSAIVSLLLTLGFIWLIIASPQTGSKIRTPFATTQAILRSLTEITGILLQALSSSTLDILTWASISTERGILMPFLLSLSPHTGLFGLLLLFPWKSWKERGSWRLWCILLLRMLLLGYSPFMKIIIMSRIIPVLSYTTQLRYQVSAGIGPFDIQFLSSWPSVALPSFVSSQAYTLLSDPTRVTTVESATDACSGPSCLSMLIAGGVAGILPDPQSIPGNQTGGADTLIVEHEQCLQGDYWDLAPSDSNISSDNCTTWNNTIEAFSICVARSQSTPDNLIAGISVCPYAQTLNQSCLIDTSWQADFQASTSFAFYLRNAATYYSLSNSTLLSLGHVASASPQNISPEEILQVFDQFFSDSDLPDFSATQGLITYVATVFNVLSLAGLSPIDGPQDFLRSLLTLPPLLFQANLLSNTTSVIADPSAPRLGLPANLYVTATLATSQNAVGLALWTVIVYTSLGGFLLLLCLVGLTFAMRIQAPNISAFPLLDFASRITAGEMPAGASVASRMSQLSYGSSREYRAHLKADRIYVRRLPMQEQGREGQVAERGDEKVRTTSRIVISEDHLLPRLRKGDKYN